MYIKYVFERCDKLMRYEKGVHDCSRKYFCLYIFMHRLLFLCFVFILYSLFCSKAVYAIPNVQIGDYSIQDNILQVLHPGQSIGKGVELLGMPVVATNNSMEFSTIDAHIRVCYEKDTIHTIEFIPTILATAKRFHFPTTFARGEKFTVSAIEDFSLYLPNVITADLANSRCGNYWRAIWYNTNSQSEYTFVLGGGFYDCPPYLPLVSSLEKPKWLSNIKLSLTTFSFAGGWWEAVSGKYESQYLREEWGQSVLSLKERYELISEKTPQYIIVSNKKGKDFLDQFFYQTLDCGASQ